MYERKEWSVQEELGLKMGLINATFRKQNKRKENDNYDHKEFIK